MKVVTLRVPEVIEMKLRVKAEMEHRTLSEQIKKYITDGMLSEEYPDLPLSFVKETLEAKKEIEAGLGEEYQFGVID
ncbi:MAG: hypothetical protein V3U24_06000 [Candidatus Neomarinimicrobiota bacterium]